MIYDLELQQSDSSSKGTMSNVIASFRDSVVSLSTTGASCAVETASTGGGSSSCLAGIWTCTSWGACENGVQTRRCTEGRSSPSCFASASEKPAETQSCGTGAGSSEGMSGDGSEGSTGGTGGSDVGGDGAGITGAAIGGGSGSTPYIVIGVIAGIGILYLIIYLIRTYI